MQATATTTLAATALFSASSLAGADSPVPQPDTACSPAISGAMTQLPDQKTYLACLNQPDGGYQWKTVTSCYPISDRWLTYGPQILLHGQGLRNNNLASGDWTATPLDPSGQCRAEQAAVVSAGVVGPAEVDQGQSGQPLSLQVLPRLFSIKMSGNCLWTKATS